MTTEAQQQNEPKDQPQDQPALDFAKAGGLIAGIVQDAKTGEVLMLGFLNELSYQKTMESGFVTFWSRTRNKLWMKGETSGNRLKIVSAATDCDNDALLFRVEVEGDGLVCHEGTVSCFTKELGIREQGTGIRDQGTGIREQGTGNREQGIDGRD